MNEEQLETRISQIVEQLEYLVMDVILMCIKRINIENQLLNEVQEIKFEEKLEKRQHQNDF